MTEAPWVNTWTQADGTESYSCSRCKRSFHHMERAVDHARRGWCPDPAAGIDDLRRELEAALEQARVEGALDALETAALIAEAESNLYAGVWGEGSSGDVALLRVAAEIRSRKGSGQ